MTKLNLRYPEINDHWFRYRLDMEIFFVRFVSLSYAIFACAHKFKVET